MNPNDIFKVLRAEIETTQYGTHPAELYDPISYIMSLGGKRLRPMLTLLSASLYTDQWRAFLKPAIAVEVFHNFTLMHDDIMDCAPLRRGQATVHEKWNPNVAILSGDVMLVQAYQLMLGVNPAQLPQVLARFNRTAADVCEGQQLDMNFEARWDVTEAEYINMIRLKTSVLLGYALELGGMLAGADAAACQLLYDAGVNMGLGFQLKDDLLDVYGDPEKFGKQVGGDIISNKKTFLLIEALTQATGQTKAELSHWLNLPTFDKAEKVRAVTQIYDSLGIKEITEAKISSYFKQGLDALAHLQPPANSVQRDVLMTFARQLVEREN